MLDRRQVVAVIGKEFEKHRMDTFVDNPPAIAQGGNGVVVCGCSICKERRETDTQFMRHVASHIIAAVKALPEST